MEEVQGEFKKHKGGVGVYAVVVLRVEMPAEYFGIQIDCDGQGFYAQGYVEEVPKIGYDSWKAGAVAGVLFALEVARRDDVMVTIKKIEGFTTDTNPAGIAAAAAKAVWQALGITPDATIASYLERMAMSGWAAGHDVVPILRPPRDQPPEDPS